MTNTTPLSSAAQAVLDTIFATTESDCSTEHLVAAALRVAADQVVPEYETTPGGSKIWPSAPVSSIRQRFLAIADELEGANG